MSNDAEISSESGDKTHTEELYSKIVKDLTDRQSWEERQRVWYEMRHNGLRRRNKPFPGAADLHFPLADGIIEKLKPFYFQQLFATETFASFISMREQADALTSAAAYWFDYKLKQKSNLETEILTTIDDMLMCGRPVMKVYWDAEKKCVRFDAVTPCFVILPKFTKEIQECDRFVHVMQMSEDQYRANDNYKQDKDLIKQISGRGTALDGRATNLEQVKVRREGLTYSDSDEVIVWEVYTRNKDKKWQVDTFSPLKPDTAVRATFLMPYNHGQLPFVDFPREIKDKGYYSPRGIPEIVASFETSLCKNWNEKMDAMTFFNRPIFTSDKEIPNTSNFRIVPGQIIPGNLQAVQMGAPPISFDQEMTNTRMIAEQRVAVPDFGIGQEINTDQRKTATEIDKLAALQGQIIDLQARLFRKSLSNVYRQAWALLCQFDEDIQYISQEKMTNLDKEAKHDAYEINPNGSADSWNKMAQLQKGVARKQLLGQSPYINQAELDKSLLELDDPRLVRRLWTDPNKQQSDQAKQQAMEIPALKEGYPVPVDPSDDDATHVQTAMQYVEAQGQKGEPVNPVAVNAIRGHVAAHIKQAIQKNPKAGKHLAKMVQMTLAPHAAAMEAQAGQPAPVPSPQPGAPPIPPKIIESINFKDLPEPAQNALLQAVGLPGNPPAGPLTVITGGKQ